jgi:hypothetical protein
MTPDEAVLILRRALAVNRRAARKLYQLMVDTMGASCYHYRKR